MACSFRKWSELGNTLAPNGVQHFQSREFRPRRAKTEPDALMAFRAKRRFAARAHMPLFGSGPSSHLTATFGAGPARHATPSPQPRHRPASLWRRR
jgi:hypothetical protein